MNCPICLQIGLERELFNNPYSLKSKECCHQWHEIAYSFGKELEKWQEEKEKETGLPEQ